MKNERRGEEEAEEDDEFNPWKIKVLNFVSGFYINQYPVLIHFLQLVVTGYC
jgi:hypothetical protein